MIFDSCVEGSIFVDESATWPTEPTLTRLDRTADLKVGRAAWQASLKLAVELVQRMPDNHPLAQLFNTGTHVTIAEVKSVRWHACSLKIRLGCYFIELSSALRTALAACSNWLTYISHGTDSEEYRDHVFRLIYSMIGNVRLGRGWQQYLDVNLKVVAQRQSHKFTQIAQVFVIIHELGHIARREIEVPPTRGHLGDQHLEHECDRDALDALVLMSHRFGSDPGEVAAAVDICLATQAILDNAHWGLAPETHPSAVARRQQVARYFNHLGAATGHDAKYSDYTATFFPEWSPGQMISDLFQAYTLPRIEVPLSRSVAQLPFIFRTTCSREVWDSGGADIVDVGEYFEHWIREHSFEHYLVRRV
jgi:hypothetical protein